MLFLTLSLTSSFNKSNLLNTRPFVAGRLETLMMAAVLNLRR